MSTLHNFEEMAGVAFPADGTGEYNRLLRDCYFTKHADFATVNMCMKEPFWSDDEEDPNEEDEE